MKIAIEGSTWVNRRGYGRFTRELIRAMVRADGDHEVTLVLDSGAAAAGDLPDLPRRVVATTHAVVEAAAAGGARGMPDLYRMSRALSSPAFDVVVFPTMYSFVPVFSRARVVVIIHDALPETVPDLVLGQGLARWRWRAKSWLACRQSDLVATVSEASARAIKASLPIGSTPVVVLTEGCAPQFSPQPDAADTARLARHVPHESPFVLYVGGINPHKRVPDLVRAFAHLDAASNLVLVLAGPDTDDSFAIDERLDDVIAAAGLGDRVIRTGFVPDETLAALYRGACCLVLPSCGEGFGLPALEAMASGTPLVVARIPALEELCGDAAEYFDEIDELATVLSRVIESPGRRLALSVAGVARSKRFGWEEGARRLLLALDVPRA